MYNIYIVEKEGRKPVKVVKDVSDHKLERIMLGMLTNLDTDNYFLADEETGSEADLAYANQL